MEQFLTKTPNPILSVTKDGIVVHSNKAAEPLLHEWGVKVGGNLPSNIIDLVQGVISLNSPGKLDVKVGNRIYLVVFSPLPQKECVNISGFDITEQREREDKIRENEEKYSHIVPTIQDSNITEGKQADEALFQSEQHYRLLYETMLQGVVYQDASGKIISMNPTAERILGKTSSELLGSSSVGEEYHTIREDGSEFPGLEHPAMVSLQTGQKVQDVVMGVYNLREKRYRWINISAVPLFRSGEDKPFQVYTLFEDITERKQMEEKTRQRAEEVEAIMEVTPVAIWIGHDPQCNNITGNRMANEFYEVEDGENVSANVTTERRFFHKGRELTADELPMQKAVSKNIDVRNEEINVLLPGGKYRTILGSASPLHSPEGNVRGSVAAFIDITERKEAEAKLEETLENLENLVKERTSELENAYKLLKVNERDLAEAQRIAHLGSWNWNLLTDKISWSDEMYRIFGLKPQEDLSFDKILNYIHPDDRDHLLSAHQEALKGKKPSGLIEFRIVSADGEKRVIHGLSEVIFNEENKPVQIRGAGQDITERKKAEEALSASEARFRSLYENSLDGILLTKPDGTILSANPQACSLFGMTEDEIIKAGRDGLVVDKEKLAAALEERRRKGLFKAELTHRRKDGSTFLGEVSSSPFVDLQGVTTSSHIIRDITERKRAEEERNQLLQDIDEQRAHLQTIIDSLPVGLWIADAAGKVGFTNNIASKIWGGKIPSSKKVDEYDIYKAWWSETGERITAEDMPLAQAVRGETHHERIVDFERFDGTHGTQLVSSAPIKMPNGTIVGGVAIVQDITELKRVEKELQRTCEKLQVQSEDLGTQGEELRIANKALNESKNRFELLSEANALLLSSNDPETIIQTIAEKVMCHLNCDVFFNYVYDEVMSRLHLNAYSGISSEAAKEIEWLDKMDESTVCGCVARDGCRIVAANLKNNRDKRADLVRSMWIQAYACQPLRIGEKTIGTISFGTKSRSNFTENELSLISYVADQVSVAIERKQAEERIRELANIVESSNDAIITKSLDGIIISWNKAAEQIYGYSAEEILGKNISILEPEDLKEEIKQLADKVKKGERVRHYETLRLKKDGTRINVSVALSPVFDIHGKLTAISVIARDITRRKKAEEALRESEERFNLAVKAAQEGIWDWNVETDEVWYSSRYKEMLGYSEDEIEHHVNSWLRLLHPDDKERSLKIVDAVMRGERNYELEFRLRHKDGHYLSILSRGYPIRRESDGKIVRIVGTHFDLTQHKKAEEALRKSKEQYQTLFNSISEGFANYEAIYDEHGALYDLLVLEINPAGARLLEIEREAQLGKTWREVWPDTENYWFEAYQKVDQTGKSVQFEGFSNITGRWYATQIDKIAKGQFVTIFRDITEEKEAEEKLRVSEEKYRNIVETANEGILITTNENIIAYVNKKLADMLKYTTEEIIGLHSWGFVSEECIPILQMNLKKRRQGENGSYELKLKRKDGSPLWVNISAKPIFDNNGKFMGSLGMHTDITERKKAEEALKNFETARKKEIHHRIKNNLQIISALLDLQAEKLKGRTNISNSEMLHAFKESQDRVLSMALIHEELYRGGETDKLNFSSYIGKLAENLILTYRVDNKDISLDMDLEENTFFDIDTAIPLGMIINELVSNSFKYAFQGRDKGEIRIRLLRDKNIEYKNKGYISNAYILSVSDNGVCIPENIDIQNLDSLGLQLVTTLTDQLDGELEIKRSSGTEFTVKFTVTEKDN